MGQIDSALRDADLEAEELYLNDCGIDYTRAKNIAKHLENNNYVQKLYMSWNGLEDHGCKYVARMLEHNFCLRFLDLSSNSIRNSGAGYLATAISVNELTSLSELNLSNNFITDEGARALVEAITLNKTISFLNLQENPITDKMMADVKLLAYRDALKHEDEGVTQLFESVGFAASHDNYSHPGSLPNRVDSIPPHPSALSSTTPRHDLDQATHPTSNHDPRDDPCARADSLSKRPLSNQADTVDDHPSNPSLPENTKPPTPIVNINHFIIKSHDYFNSADPDPTQASQTEAEIRQRNQLKKSASAHLLPILVDQQDDLDSDPSDPSYPGHPSSVLGLSPETVAADHHHESNFPAKIPPRSARQTSPEEARVEIGPAEVEEEEEEEDYLESLRKPVKAQTEPGHREKAHYLSRRRREEQLEQQKQQKRRQLEEEKRKEELKIAAEKREKEVLKQLEETSQLKARANRAGSEFEKFTKERLKIEKEKEKAGISNLGIFQNQRKDKQANLVDEILNTSPISSPKTNDKHDKNEKSVAQNERKKDSKSATSSPSPASLMGFLLAHLPADPAASNGSDTNLSEIGGTRSLDNSEITQKSLEMKQKQLQAFARLSADFRRGKLTGKTYYRAIANRFGRHNLSVVPDRLIQALQAYPERQHELEQTHKLYLQNEQRKKMVSNLSSSRKSTGTDHSNRPDTSSSSHPAEPVDTQKQSNKIGGKTKTKTKNKNKHKHKQSSSLSSLSSDNPDKPSNPSNPSPPLPSTKHTIPRPLPSHHTASDTLHSAGNGSSEKQTPQKPLYRPKVVSAAELERERVRAGEARDREHIEAMDRAARERRDRESRAWEEAKLSAQQQRSKHLLNQSIRSRSHSHASPASSHSSKSSKRKSKHNKNKPSKHNHPTRTSTRPVRDRRTHSDDHQNNSISNGGNSSSHEDILARQASLKKNNLFSIRNFQQDRVREREERQRQREAEREREREQEAADMRQEWEERKKARAEQDKARDRDRRRDRDLHASPHKSGHSSPAKPHKTTHKSAGSPSARSSPGSRENRAKRSESAPETAHEAHVAWNRDRLKMKKARDQARAASSSLSPPADSSSSIKAKSAAGNGSSGNSKRQRHDREREREREFASTQAAAASTEEQLRLERMRNMLKKLKNPNNDANESPLDSDPTPDLNSDIPNTAAPSSPSSHTPPLSPDTKHPSSKTSKSNNPNSPNGNVKRNNKNKHHNKPAENRPSPSPPSPPDTTQKSAVGSENRNNSNQQKQKDAAEEDRKQALQQLMQVMRARELAAQEAARLKAETSRRAEAAKAAQAAQTREEEREREQARERERARVLEERRKVEALREEKRREREAEQNQIMREREIERMMKILKEREEKDKEIERKRNKLNNKPSVDDVQPSISKKANSPNNPNSPVLADIIPPPPPPQQPSGHSLSGSGSNDKPSSFHSHTSHPTHREVDRAQQRRDADRLKAQQAIWAAEKRKAEREALQRRQADRVEELRKQEERKELKREQHEVIKQKIQKSLSDWKNQHCKMDFTAFYRLQASDPSAAAKMKPALLLWSCLADLHAIFPPIPPATGPTYRLSTGLNAKSTPGQVKKAYHKALLLVHPDKQKHIEGSDPTRSILAGAVFLVLREAYDAFNKAQSRQNKASRRQ